MQLGKATNASGTVHMEILSGGGWRARSCMAEGCAGRGGDIIYVKGWRGRYGIVARGWLVPTVLP